MPQTKKTLSPSDAYIFPLHFIFRYSILHLNFFNLWKSYLLIIFFILKDHLQQNEDIQIGMCSFYEISVERLL